MEMDGTESGIRFAFDKDKDIIQFDYNNTQYEIPIRDNYIGYFIDADDIFNSNFYIELKQSVQSGDMDTFEFNKLMNNFINDLMNLLVYIWAEN